MQKEVFPRKLQDRRLFPHAPVHNGDRRVADRFTASQHVIITLCGPGGEHTCAMADVDDISTTGLSIHGLDFTIGQRYELEFSLPPGVMPEGYESAVKLPATAVRKDEKNNATAFKFERSLEKYFRKRRWRRLEVYALLLLCAAIAAISLIKLDNVFYFWFDAPIFLYGLCVAGMLATRFLFAALYRPTPVNPEFTPPVSIIVPCYNEQDFVARTVRLCFDQDYPTERIQVIAVNDGSTDGSAEALDSLKAIMKENGADYEVIHFESNRGKREALRAGVLAARHDLVVMVDSDSFLAPDAIRQLVQPLQDDSMAGVCGFCTVENKWTNFLTKMQAVHYFIMFRVFKAAEGLFEAVTCLSGPLSVYRKQAILPHMDAWVNQRVLGFRATLADDRALTNMVLRHNRLAYQHTATCSTIAPSSYRHFYSQQMRWMRSWLLESLIGCRFMWRKEPFMAISYYLGIILPLLAPLVVLRAFILEPLVYDALPLLYLAGILLMAALMASSYLLINRSKLWLYGIPFSFFYLVMLFVMLPQAAFTMLAEDWGKRRVSTETQEISS